MAFSISLYGYIGMFKLPVASESLRFVRRLAFIFVRLRKIQHVISPRQIIKEQAAAMPEKRDTIFSFKSPYIPLLVDSHSDKSTHFFLLKILCMHALIETVN